MLTGMRGNHILIDADVVSLKNMEELVQDREAICLAGTWPPIIEIWMAKPPTQCATTCTFMDFSYSSMILFIAAEKDNILSLARKSDGWEMQNFFTCKFTSWDVYSTNIFDREVVCSIRWVQSRS